MRYLAVIFGAATLCSVATLASAQQLPQRLPNFKAGEAVDYFTFGRWLPCTVVSPADHGIYSLKCGDSLSLRAKADPLELRAHVAPAPSPMARVEDGKDVDFRSTGTRTIGARYGTREPRTCEQRTTPLSTDKAKDIFICDSEHEFGGSLFLVSDVNLSISSPRPFDPKVDLAKQGIDPAQPVYDLHASYNDYQCHEVAVDRDNPLDRNCKEYKMSDASGGCYKNQAGEWHCMTYDLHPGSVANAAMVRPPTVVE